MVHRSYRKANQVSMMLVEGGRYKIEFDDKRFQDIDFQTWEHRPDCKSHMTPKLRLKDGMDFKDLFAAAPTAYVNACIVRERSVSSMHQSLPRHLEDWNEENVQEFFHAYKKPVLTRAGDYLREVYGGGQQLKVQKNLLDYLTRGETVTLADGQPLTLKMEPMELAIRVVHDLQVFALETDYIVSFDLQLASAE